MYVTMKLRYLVLGLALLSAGACSKKDPSVPGSGNNGQTTNTDPVTVDESIFTDPGLISTKSSSTIIMDSLVKYLSYTPKGAVVYINVFLFSYPPVVSAVKAAYVRGVQMKVIIDSSRDDSRSENDATIKLLESTFQSPSEILTTDNEIDATWAINHSKYVLFSEVDLPRGIAKNVVFATSHNFTLGQTKMIQDAVVMTNKALYDAFVDNWEQLATYAKDMQDYQYTVKDAGDSITAFFFPRRKDGKWDGGDTILDQLAELSDYSKDTVRVFMASTWSGARGVNIAKALTDLEKKGARVEVITMSDIDASVITQLNVLSGAGGYVKIMDVNKEVDHSKVMLIKGVWDGSMQRIVLMGSENYGEGALKYNNNFLLRLRNSSLFASYWNYYEKLKITL